MGVVGITLCHLCLQARFDRTSCSWYLIVHRREWQLWLCFLVFASIDYLLHSFSTSCRIDTISLWSILRLANNLVDLYGTSSSTWLNNSMLLIATTWFDLSLSTSLSDSLNHSNYLFIFILLHLGFIFIYFQLENTVTTAVSCTIRTATNRPRSFIVHRSLPLMTVPKFEFFVLRLNIRKLWVTRFWWINSSRIHRCLGRRLSNL